MKNGRVPLEGSLAISYKTKHVFVIQPPLFITSRIPAAQKFYGRTSEVHGITWNDMQNFISPYLSLFFLRNGTQLLKEVYDSLKG